VLPKGRIVDCVIDGKPHAALPRFAHFDKFRRDFVN
jgi:hypothetical protein